MSYNRDLWQRKEGRAVLRILETSRHILLHEYEHWKDISIIIMFVHVYWKPFYRAVLRIQETSRQILLHEYKY